MSYLLPHLHSGRLALAVSHAEYLLNVETHTGWHVDQAILAEEDRVVIIRFGHDHVSCISIAAWL